MKTNEIVQLLDGQLLTYNDYNRFDYCYGFASDLMSDVLNQVGNDSEKTILITGLCNEQVVRTCEMLDVSLIVFVRNKIPNISLCSLAKDKHIDIILTSYTMFETCGILSKKGLKSYGKPTLLSI